MHRPFYIHFSYTQKIGHMTFHILLQALIMFYNLCVMHGFLSCLLNDSDSIKIFQLFSAAMATQDTKENISQDPQVFLPLIIRKQCWISIRILPNVTRVSETNSLDKSFTVFTHYLQSV